MPCRDYESDYANGVDYSLEYDRLNLEYDKIKERCDMLARIACNIMLELEKTPDMCGCDIMGEIMKNPEIQAWWENHQIEDMKALEAKKKTFRKRVLSAIDSAGNAEFVEEELRNILKEKTND